LRFRCRFKFRSRAELRAIARREFTILHRHIFDRIHGPVRMLIKLLHFIQMKRPRPAPTKHDSLIPRLIDYAIAIQPT